MSDLPQSFRAGDTLTWTISLSAYPASDGWSLTYTLINATRKVTITSTASGSEHLLSVSAATSAGYAPGLYTWTAAASKNDQRISLSSGTVEILPNLAALATYDGRTQAKRILDAIDAVLDQRATGVEMELEMNGRRIRYFTPDELKKWRIYWVAEVRREQAAERLANGLGGPQKVLVRI